MSIERDTQRYEAWLRQQCHVVKADLKFKHKRMDKNAFAFLRATYYRWARKIEEWCPELADAPRVLAIGDTHTENFGTWRDREGRLVWGINDFDEAAVMPYVLDLVRLATSAALAAKLLLSPRAACAAILSGYRDGLAKPRPTLLEEEALWMRELVAASDADCADFWDEVKGYPDAEPPKKVAAGLTRSLPKGAHVVRFCTRRKGGGGLGRPRIVAVAEWHGGHLVSEAKAFVPSAWDWAHDRSPRHPKLLTLATGRFRSADPFFDIDGRFIYRRIAADSRKIELGEQPGKHLSRKVLQAMGLDLGAIHAADSKRVKHIAKDLSRRPAGWLHAAAETAAAAVQREHRIWRARKDRSGD